MKLSKLIHELAIDLKTTRKFNWDYLVKEVIKVYQEKDKLEKEEAQRILEEGEG